MAFEVSLAYRTSTANQQAHGATVLFPTQPRIVKANGDVVHLWSSIDSLVLKLLSMFLADVLSNSKRCTHLKRHGGAKQTVNSVYRTSQQHEFVFRTDVKSYYESIDHHILLNKLAHYIKDKHLLNILTQYLKRSIEVGGNFIDIDKGISSGSPLSPLIASFYLYELDKAMEKQSVYYRRYMDDIIVLAKSRWGLKRTIRCVNQHFELLELKQHPEKTQTGRIKAGFDFLGYQFKNEGLSASKSTIQNYIFRLSRLYEQKKSHPNWMTYLEDYRQHWFCWAKAGLNVTFQDGLKINDDVLHLNPIMPVQTSL